MVIDDGAPFAALYGASRGDTAGVCQNDGNNGWAVAYNWNLLARGAHTIRALADGVEFARVDVQRRPPGRRISTGCGWEFPGARLSRARREYHHPLE